MAKQEQKRFFIQAEVKATIYVEMMAKSIEDAYEKAKGMAADDFVTPVGEVADMEFALTGVYR